MLKSVSDDILKPEAIRLLDYPLTYNAPNAYCLLVDSLFGFNASNTYILLLDYLLGYNAFNAYYFQDTSGNHIQIPIKVTGNSVRIEEVHFDIPNAPAIQGDPKPSWMKGKENWHCNSIGQEKLCQCRHQENYFTTILKRGKG